MKTLKVMIMTAALSGLAACASPQTKTRPAVDLQQTLATPEVAPVVAVLNGADARDWPRVAAVFAPRVVLDYGAPELMSPEEIVGLWRPLLSAFDHTAHRLETVALDRLSADRVRVRSTFSAVHQLAGAEGGDTWTLTGRYEHELLRIEGVWRISRMRMIPEASTGNTGLMAQAQARAGLSAPPPAKVQIQPVNFVSEGEALVGLLHRPAGVAEGARLPAVVVVGSWTTVKEQMASHYARALAEAGYVALTFDSRGFGESGGVPRFYESPDRKVADLRAAVGFLGAQASVDPARIGLVGVCASSGYVAQAAAEDSRVRSVAMVAPWLHDRALVEAVYGGAEGVAARTAAGEAARAHFEATGEVKLVPAASSTDDQAAMYAPDPAFLAYYLSVERGGIPQWGNRFAVMSWPEWLGFDAVALAPSLKAPTLMVHSEAAAIPDGAHRFAAAMPTRPTEVWLDGVNQFQFYDDPTAIQQAVKAVTAHLARTLGDEQTHHQRQRNRKTIEAFFARLEAFDIDGFAALFAEDARQLMPYAPEGFPRVLNGRAAIFNQYKGMPDHFTAMTFPGVKVQPMQDPERFFVTFKGAISLKGGGEYRNTYAALFVVKEGAITEYHEYFDPIVLQRAFGNGLAERFNVQ